MTVEQNILRLKNLQKIFSISDVELLGLIQNISQPLKKQIKPDQIFSNNIDIRFLKRIDKIFNKGLHYYLDPKNPDDSKEASIFFRKNSFNTQLNLASRQIVNKFEEIKLSLSAISKLSDIKTERSLPVVEPQTNPQKVAMSLREKLYPEFSQNKKDFLTSLITKLADYKIIVFEFIENWNKKEKTNIDGFFIQPNVIVLKRQQEAFNREIFTLIHELGHYLLLVEDIDYINYDISTDYNNHSVEKWCNDFAYYFLIGKYDDELNNLSIPEKYLEYNSPDIISISQKTHLSRLALFTRLLYSGQISINSYNRIKKDLDKDFAKKKEEKEKQKALDKLRGKKFGGAAPKPINSPLLISTIQVALYEGIINEYEACKTLNITSDKLERYFE